MSRRAGPWSRGTRYPRTVSAATAAWYNSIRPDATPGDPKCELQTSSASESLITKADANRSPRTVATANRAAAYISTQSTPSAW